MILTVAATLFLSSCEREGSAKFTASSINPETTKTFIAYSLKQARVNIEAAIIAGDNFRANNELYKLGGISRPIAAVIDEANSDVILLGERIDGAELLNLDDVSVALRAAFLHPYDHPGVSIEPKSCVGCESQDVIYFAGIENSRMGKICFEADWLLKLMALGRIPTEFESLFSRSVRSLNTTADPVSELIARFWFYPIQNRVSVTDNLVWLGPFRLGVFEEVLSVKDSSGRPLSAADYYDEPAAKYAEDYSAAIDTLAEKHQVLMALDAMMRLVGVTKGLARLQNTVDMDYFVYEYAPLPEDNKESVNLLHEIDDSIGFALSGGVDLLSLVLRLGEGDSDAFVELAAISRPKSDSLSWPFSVTIDDGLPIGVQIQDSKVLLDDTLALYTQGWFYFRQRRYAEAVEAFETLDGMLKAQPSEVRSEIKWALGIALRSLVLKEGASGAVDGTTSVQRIERVLALFREASGVDPLNWAPIYELGVTHRAFGNSQEAVDEFTRAVELEPRHPETQFGLGMALESLGSLERAKLHIEEAIDLSLEQPYLDEAVALLARIEQHSKTSVFNTYQDPSARFRMLTPADWATLTPQQARRKTNGMFQPSPSAVLFIGNPANWDQNMNIQIGETTPVTRQQLLDVSKQMDASYRQNFSGYRKLGDHISAVDGALALEFRLEQERLNMKLTQMVFIYVKNSQFVTFTATAPSSQFETLEKEKFRRIIDSFQL